MTVKGEKTVKPPNYQSFHKHQLPMCGIPLLTRHTHHNLVGQNIEHAHTSGAGQEADILYCLTHAVAI